MYQHKHWHWFNGIILDAAPSALAESYIMDQFCTILNEKIVIEGKLPYEETPCKEMLEFIESQREN